MGTIIFSKDYRKKIKKEITFFINNPSDSAYTSLAGRYDRVINTLNRFIKKGNKIDDIDLGQLSELPPRKDPKKLVLKIVDDLKFEYYRNSKRRPRHDHDSSWKEIEIRNLPNDKYLQKLIASVLPGKTKKTEFGLLLIIDYRPTSWSSGKREKIKDPKDKRKKIKSNLKLDLYKEYNYTHRLLENITKDGTDVIME